MDHLYPPNIFQIVDNVFSYHYLRFVILIFNPFFLVFLHLFRSSVCFFVDTVDILLIFIMPELICCFNFVL